MSCEDKKAEFLSAQEVLTSALAERTQAIHDKAESAEAVEAAIAADNQQALVVDEAQAAVVTAGNSADVAYSAWIACITGAPYVDPRSSRR